MDFIAEFMLCFYFMMRLEKSWHAALKEELSKPYILQLKRFLEEEKGRGVAIFPPEADVFSAFRYTPYDKVKVVLMGQDPYHGEGQAHGLCFSVKRGVPPPPSLKNIYKEMEADLHLSPPVHGSLVKWAQQGVLLLNATLTVRKGEPKSHYGKGWERFTDGVIYTLACRKDPLVFILWGASAREKCQRILGVLKHPHAILTAAHPSPLSATQFFGCRHFSKANRFLKEWNKSAIDWNLNE